MNELEQKREFYRLKYPKKARPCVRLYNQIFYVTEVSEGGIRVVMNMFTDWYKGLSMSGTLELNSSTKIDVEGAVLRFDNGEVVVKLKQGPTFKNMVEEQRHIRQEYPAHFVRAAS
ncbi:PilZ domain-containing protein [Vibrio pectenicida]|uniref:PilZ domain-containing protein n=1 Tax=Vibrio TaxID=662 RepID=UPI001C0A3660|nr:PilZ domain-containing protein [Vibrio hepatarius]MBU2898113.1 PilZ domain-containing protein [Vibrio hepatarius]